MRCSLNKFLTDNNITQKEASEKTGISENVIRRVVRGTIPASQKTREAFKTIYDLDIIEISNAVLTRNEAKEECKQMKEEIKTIKAEYKNDLTELKQKYKAEGNELRKQIEELEKQAEIKDLKLSLAQILTSDDSFFKKPEVLKYLKKLVSLFNVNEDDEKDEVQEDDNLELATEEDNEANAFDSDVLEEDDLDSLESEMTINEDNDLDYLDDNFESSYETDDSDLFESDSEEFLTTDDFSVEDL